MGYRSFFSYARADDRIANWLHRGLDSYRTPKPLVGSEGALGPVPAKLHPIFRDRTDLQAGGQVDAFLQAALEESETLIVLCTPTSAKSFWVNHECETFLKLGRVDRIFSVIAAGEPNSGDESECFPPALRGKGLLAADLREIKRPNGQLVGDGRESGRLKLIAGLLGVGLDQLAQRERRRQQVFIGRLTATAIAFAALAIAAGGLGWLSEQRRVEAEAQRNLAVVRLEDAQAALNEYSSLLLRVDPQPRTGRSVIHAFPGTDGDMACAADAACSGDYQALRHEIASTTAFVLPSENGQESGETVKPELAALWRNLCSDISRLGARPYEEDGGHSSLYSSLCAGTADIDAQIGIVALDDLIVTHFVSPAYCGSGGCTDTFTVWRGGERPFEPLLACEGDAFALRLIDGAPTTAYCMNRHSAGCGNAGYYLAAAPYVAQGWFTEGPIHYSSELSEVCNGEDTRIAIRDTQEGYVSPFELLK